MESILISLISSGLMLLGLVSGDADAAPPEGWIAKAIQAATDNGEDAYERGYDFGENDVEMLLKTWRIHDAMTRKVMDADLEDVAKKTAELADGELSPATLREMEGLDDGLSTAGEETSTDEMIGWNAFMDLSLHWGPRIDGNFPGPESGSLVAVGGTLYSIQTANKPHSLTAPDRNTLRFEVASGDNWGHDSERYERAEIAGPVYPAGEMLTVTFDLMIEPGEPSEAEWLLLGQFHADDPDTPPPFAIEFEGNEMKVRARFMRDGEIEDIRLYRDSEDIERGRYYRMKIRAYFPKDKNDTGVVRVWRDGTQIVDYDGPLGYGYGAYWKAGIYRRQTSETIAANYRDLFVTGEHGMIVAAEGKLENAD